MYWEEFAVYMGFYNSENIYYVRMNTVVFKKEKNICIVIKFICKSFWNVSLNISIKTVLC